MMKGTPKTGASAATTLGSWAEDGSLGMDLDGFDTGDDTPPSEIDIGADIGVPGIGDAADDGGGAEGLGAGGDEFDMGGGTPQSIDLSGGFGPEPEAAPSGMLTFVKDNQQLLGGALAGLGKGLGGYMTAESNERIADKKFQADRELLAQKNALTEGKWSSTPGMLNMGDATRTGGPTPAEKYDSRAYQGNYVWDPKANRFVFMPAQTAPATA
jgi:hypothetical protein